MSNFERVIDSAVELKRAIEKFINYHQQSIYIQEDTTKDLKETIKLNMKALKDDVEAWSRITKQTFWIE